MATKPLENRTFQSGFRMVASLDRFIKKRVMNKIFFMPKRSRLVRKISGPDIECIRKPDKKVSEKCPFEYRTVRYSVAYCINFSAKKSTETTDKGIGYHT
jgi:hypothetical protein